MAETNSATCERAGVRIAKPGQFGVVFHNDDFTPMDFVVELLTGIFSKSVTEAYRLMMKVHKEGKSIVGTYSYDIACSKQSRAVGLARDYGYPLQITVEKA